MSRAAHPATYRGFRVARTALLAGVGLLAVALLIPSTAGAFSRRGAGAATAVANAPAGCGSATLSVTPGTPSTVTDPAIVARVGGLGSAQVPAPAAIVIDTTDPRGRVFVGSLSAGTVSVIDGRASRPGDIKIETTISVGNNPGYLALDPNTGRVFVSLAGDCQIKVLDGRAPNPAVIGSVDVPGNPSGIAFDPQTGRLFVAIPLAGDVVVLDRSLAVAATIPVGLTPTTLALDPGTGYLYVGCFGTPSPAGPQDSSLQVLDARAGTPSIVLSDYGLAYPAGFVSDPTTNSFYAVLNTNGDVAVFHGSGGGLAQTGVVKADPFVALGGRPGTATLLPKTHELLVTLLGSDRASVFRIDQSGGLTFDRYVFGLVGGVTAALDPATGRVFVAEEAIDEVAVAALDDASAPAPSIQYVLPGPLDISLAPQDVARSVGIAGFLMLLLGAPTTLFNSTLSANRRLIERWLRRKRPARARRSDLLARLAALIDGWSHAWLGLFSYLALATVLYAFVNQTFPNQDPIRTLFVTAFGIAVGTAVSQLPGEAYVRRYFGEGGRVEVALWTAGLAAVFVVVTRATGVQPGYVYGIIGGFTFAAVLSDEHRGRMAFAGMSTLLAVGLAAWVLRVPFQPNVATVGGDVGSLTNQLLATTFVNAVQGVAIGLIPLRYLAGEKLFLWSRPRWLLLWAASVVLFVHVILYPVSSLEPHPNSVGLWTIAATVTAYGAIAVAFWWFFRRRELRREHRRTAHGSQATAKPSAAHLAVADGPPHPPTKRPKVPVPPS